jgi:DNA polymerase-1|tara:strand:- start:175 stop:1230 length:1056 start_codon:yes stop_codon:yes gene_type:complete
VINQKHLSILEEIKKSGGKVDSGEPNDSVLLIDGLNTFIRVFSAIPTTNEDGVHIGGIVGFLRSIGYTINMVRPTRTIIVFDGKGGSNRRRKIYPQYKMGRKMSHRLNRTHDFLTRDEEKKMMVFQLNRIVEYLECLPLTIINMDGIEADDVIGYCAKHIFKDSKSTIMSTDKDFLQLVDENIRVYSPTKKKMYDEEKVVEEYGISSHNFLLYRMLDGDVSDSIPGVKGVGLKSLIKHFPFLEDSHKHTIEDVLKSASVQKDKYKLCEDISESQDQMLLNKKLMDLDDVNISGNSKLKIQNITSNPIQRIVKHKFQKMFLEDKMYTALPNLNSWLHTTFNRLNFMAEKTHE